MPALSQDAGPAMTVGARELAERLDEIERALKFDPDPAYRRELIREYLRLTDPAIEERAAA